MGFPKIKDTFLEGPYSSDYNIWGSRLESPIWEITILKANLTETLNPKP